MTDKGIVMVTGATAGIGKATAEIFAENGHDVIITGRRQERLEKIKSQLEKEHGVEVLPLNFDVRYVEKVNTAIERLEGKWKNIDILINNAGLAAGLSTIDEGDIDDWERMIDTNVKGLLYVTRAVSPQMVKRKTGHIINVASVAGKEVYLKGNVYCATKHAADALSQGMRMDFNGKGIKVTNIAPGLVETEFSEVRFKGDKEKAKKVYEGYQPLTGRDIAETIYFAATRPKHVNIADVLVLAADQATATMVSR